MVRELTEEEVCELAEIRNRLENLVFEGSDKDITTHDLIYLLYLEILGLKEGLTFIIYGDDDEDEVSHIEFEEKDNE